MDPVTLVGLDFGTTTSSAVVADAALVQSSVTGRRELDDIRERFRSEMVFTPLDDAGRLDVLAVETLLESWLAQGRVRPDEVFGGGALLTGLTARKENAAALVQLVQARLGNALIATADDPRLESWLAFLGSCGALSRERPDQPILNLDIGGGTTNLALGRNGQVLRTGCLFVGARHVQVVPGSHDLVRVSTFARRLMDELEIASEPGRSLARSEVRALLDVWGAWLEAIVSGRDIAQHPALAHEHIQVPFRLPNDIAPPAITFSGGVGELVYAHRDGRPWPTTTRFGDLGIDLAQRIVESPLLSRDLHTARPASAGRATVYGLLRHSTEVSGATLFLPRPEILPLADVPIVGRIDSRSTNDDLREALALVRHSPRGGCLQIVLGSQEASTIRTLGGRIAEALRAAAFPPDHPLVLVMRENLGKVLGHYVTAWGALPLTLVIIDEVAVRDAQYMQIGAPRSNVVPVSFYGLNEPGERP